MRAQVILGSLPSRSRVQPLCRARGKESSETGLNSPRQGGRREFRAVSKLPLPPSELILQLSEINFTGSKALRMDVVEALYCANNGAADVVGRGWLSEESLRKSFIHTRLFEDLKAS